MKCCTPFSQEDNYGVVSLFLRELILEQSLQHSFFFFLAFSLLFLLLGVFLSNLHPRRLLRRSIQRLLLRTSGRNSFCSPKSTHIYSSRNCISLGSYLLHALQRQVYHKRKKVFLFS